MQFKVYCVETSLKRIECQHDDKMWSRSFTVILLLVAFGESQTQYHFGPSRNAGSKVFPGGEVAKGHTQFNRSTFNIEKKTCKLNHWRFKKLNFDEKFLKFFLFI